MESWTRVIVEWVNCLGITEPIIDDLQDLKNSIFYENLVAKLSCRDKQSAKSDSSAAATTNFTLSIDEHEPVSKFIEGEYPEFANDNETDRNIPDDLYTASLLLTQCSQKDAFQRTMCSNLKHETQIHIKRFLELVLPYGKSLTREALAAAITEVGDATPNTPPSTPKPSRPLREFFNSPAARSARSQRFMNDRNREIIRLKAQLETERFEKADLMEDMQIQEEKIVNLQKKLETKCQELKALRNERLKPPTPQSCRKNKRQSDTEERYKRELEEFENVNAALKSEIDDLRDEREQLARRIISKDRVHAVLKEKLDVTERSLEALALQIEAKNNELLDMRMNNEQLREHIREIQRSSLGEQSFEMEPIGRVTSPMLMNNSEALSSIVDIQLQEVREESAQLKIQLEAINKRFEETTRECQLLNSMLYEKTSQLTEIANRNQFLLSEFNRAEETIRQTEDKVKHLSDELSRVEEEKIQSFLAKAKLEEHTRHAEEKICMLQANISDCEVRIKELDRIKSEEMNILRDELADKRLMIDALTRRLDESTNREHEITAQLEVAKNKLAKLTNLAQETETQLAHEREQLLQKENELAHTIKDKHVLEEEIASFVQLTENTSQRINRLEIELEESRKNLRQEIATNAALTETESELKKIRYELEDKLTREQSRLELVLNEKNTLEKELALSVESTINIEKHLKYIEKELEESNKKLNAAQEKEKTEINARLALEKKLEVTQDELETIRAERKALDEELSACVRSAGELTERIKNIEKNLEDCRNNLQEQLAANSLLRDEQDKLVKQRTNLEKELSHKQEELESIVGEKKETSLLIDSLKSQLADCNENLRQQRDAIVTMKNEKIKMNEMRSMLENKLELEKQELRETKTEKDVLNRKLSAHACSVVKLREQIENVEKNLEDCHNNLQEQLAANTLLRDERDKLMKQRTILEKELSHKQEKLESIVGEKKEASLLIDSLKSQLADCNEKLQQQRDTIVTIENEKIKINEMRSMLEKKLELEKQELRETKTEKDVLNRKLSAHACSVVKLREQIENVEKNLEDCRNNLQEQLAANTLLRDERDKLMKQRTILEKELSHKQEELESIVGEKKEASLLIDSLKSQLADCNEKLQQQRDAIVTMKNEKIKINEMRSMLEKELELEKQKLLETKAEKHVLNGKLSAHACSMAELSEQIENVEKNLEDCRNNLQEQLAANALLRDEQNELVKQRTDLEKELSDNREKLSIIEREKEEASFGIDSLKSQLIEYINREEKLQETLHLSECEKSQLVADLKLARDEITALQKRITEISDCATSTNMQINELKRVKNHLTQNFNERIESLNGVVASLEKRLVSSETACAEAKLEEKLKEEAMELLQVKLEQLTKEKIESELRMKEVIVNLQEVRTSQDGVLEAQVKTLNEKSRQLNETEKELDILKASLLSKSSDLEKESQLAEELREALTIERNNVKDSIGRWEKLKTDIENIARKITIDVKPELTELWNNVSSACPEVANLRVEDPENQSEEFVDTTEKQITETIQSVEEKAKASRKAVAILVESNDKLNNKIKKVTKVSRSLKLELNTLRETVQKVCPELVRPNEVVCLDDHDETADIFCTIESFTEDAKIIGKTLSILTEKNVALKDLLENEKKIIQTSKSEDEERKIEFNERIAMMESEREKRDSYLSSLANRKKDLQLLVSTVVAKRDQVDEKLCTLTNRWSNIGNEAQNLLTAGSSSCDEVKHLQIKRIELDDILAKMSNRHTCGSKPLLKVLCRIFVWSEIKLQEVKLVDGLVKNGEFFAQNELFEEEELLKAEMCNNEEISKTLEDVSEKMDCFSRDLKSYETGLKVGAIKREASNEEKLQAQVEKMIKERKEMKDKLDAMRTRNAKLEKNMDDLRNENKKLKTQESTSSVVEAAESNVMELERLEKLTDNLTKEIQRLQKDNEQLSKNKASDEARLKEVHHEYELKLEKIKQKMKTVYNEQIAKLNEEQEKIMKNKVEVLRRQMEQQCQKYTDDIAKYKDHISDLSSRFWDVGEKLLAEKQEKQAALQQLEQLKGQKQQLVIAETNQPMTIATQSRQKTSSLDRRDFGADRTTRESSTRSGYRAVEMIEEETTTYSTRRRSVQSIQAMGNAFNAEDEEGEVFDSVYLADLKEGRCAPPMGPDFDRISELRTRNSMCRPHLRSAYAVETHVQPITLSEDDIKNGGTGDDVFNDSLSQSLLPGQKPKKKDRTQTSYKRPGPPTPSKNGGRLSLQGNELKSPSRGILKEKNVDRRTTATPRGLKNLFGTSISRRQDENSTSTPKGRRLSSIFRKQRTERN